MTRGGLLAAVGRSMVGGLILGGAILGAIPLSGCSGGNKAQANAEDAAEKAKVAKEKAAREKKEEAERINVVTTPGTADRRDPVKHTKLYTISWESSAIALGRKGIEEGKMNGVSGTVYEGEKPKSTFTAETGYAKKETQTLFLEGQVVIKSPAYKATLRAKKLEWLPDVKRYRATGDVTVEGEWGVMGPTDVLLASSDLKKVGTPKAYDLR